MSPVYKFSNSRITSKTTYASMLAGNTTYVPPSNYMLLAHLTTAPYYGVWNLTGSDGATFGTKVTNPANISGVTAYGHMGNWSKTGSAIVIGVNSTPYVAGYPWTSGTSPAWGTKFSDPATLPAGTCNSISFTNNDVIVGSNSSPYVLSYKWSNSTGFGTKYSDPATLPAGGYYAFVNDAGTAVAGAHANSPYTTGYPYTDNSGFGTKYSNPATLPGGNGGQSNWNRASSALVIGFEAGNTYTGGTHGVWKWSSGYSTKYSDPSSAPDNYYGSQQPAFNSTDTALGWAQYSKVSGSKIQVYAWDNTNGYGTKYSQPAAGDVNDGRGFGFNPGNTAVSYATNTSPYVHLWAWSNSTGFGTKSADPATLPGGLGGGLTMAKN